MQLLTDRADELPLKGSRVHCGTVNKTQPSYAFSDSLIYHRIFEITRACLIATHRTTPPPQRAVMLNDGSFVAQSSILHAVCSGLPEETLNVLVRAQSKAAVSSADAQLGTETQRRYRL